MHKWVLEKIIEEGYQAYFVGGLVRDEFLGLQTIDIDIASSAPLSVVEALFSNEKIVMIQKQLEVCTFKKSGYEYTIARMRKESAYSANRRPEQLIFVNDIKEDAARRDFTMNAIYQDIDDHIIDPYNGVDDIKMKKIQVIGDAQIRFEEDPIRILRLVRFESKYQMQGNKINPYLYLLARIRKELMRKELDKILSLNRLSEQSLPLFTYLFETEPISLESLQEMSFEKRLNYLLNHTKADDKERLALEFGWSKKKIKGILKGERI